MVNAFARKGASAPAPSLLERWPGPGRARALFGGGYALAFAITTLAIWLVATAPRTGPIAPASRTLIIVLGLNLLLILGLASWMGLRVARLVRRRQEDAGARLHLRFVALFGAAAVVPAVVVALFFGVLVTRGVESWFSKDVRQSVENSATIGRNYIKDVDDQMNRDLQAMTNELGQIRPLYPNRLSFSNALTSLAEFRGYAALYLISSDGTVLARGETARAPPYLGPPQDALTRAAAGEAPSAVTEGPDAVRALYPLSGYQNTYLYVVRTLQPGMVTRLRNSSAEITAYRERAEARQAVQIAFSLAYGEISLLVLVGAAWLGMSTAGQHLGARIAPGTGGGPRRRRRPQRARRYRRGPRGDRRAVPRLQPHDRRPAGAAGSAEQPRTSRRRIAAAVHRDRAVRASAPASSAWTQRGRVSVVNRQATTLLGLGQAKARARPVAVASWRRSCRGRRRRSAHRRSARTTST